VKLASMAASIVVAAVASLPHSSPLGLDPPLPRDERHHHVAIIRRKEPPAPPDEVTAIPTLGTLFHLHGLEAVPLSEGEPSPDRFSDLLADKAVRGRIDIAPPLLGVLRSFARAHPGARIDIVSGYRSPKRNEMMRKKGRHVASHSQHTRGQAVDFRVEGLDVADMVHEIEAAKWKGGLGRYDQKHDRFVHVDVGPDRRWRGN
jgi:hypothetical protein